MSEGSGHRNTAPELVFDIIAGLVSIPFGALMMYLSWSLILKVFSGNSFIGSIMWIWLSGANLFFGGYAFLFGVKKSIKGIGSAFSERYSVTEILKGFFLLVGFVVAILLIVAIAGEVLKAIEDIIGSIFENWPWWVLLISGIGILVLFNHLTSTYRSW